MYARVIALVLLLNLFTTSNDAYSESSGTTITSSSISDVTEAISESTSVLVSTLPQTTLHQSTASRSTSTTILTSSVVSTSTRIPLTTTHTTSFSQQSLDPTPRPTPTLTSQTDTQAANTQSTDTQSTNTQTTNASATNTTTFNTYCNVDNHQNVCVFLFSFFLIFFCSVANLDVPDLALAYIRFVAWTAFAVVATPTKSSASACRHRNASVLIRSIL